MNYPSVHRWLVEHTSLEPSLLQGAGFETVVAERLAESATDESAYVATLERSAEEVNRLTANIAVPETWLFRYPRSFDLLVDFLQRRHASAPAPSSSLSLRVCSIGCATGQEPYCIAMAALHAGWSPSQVGIIGLDRNQDFLRAAAAAEYGPASIRGEIPSWAVQFLNRYGDQVGIDPAVRSMVQFSQVDITEPAALAPIGVCDAIFCRNVLIYLNTEARVRLLSSICNALAPDGLLFVGHAEQVIRGSVPLRAVAAPHAFALERATQVVSTQETSLPARNPAKPASKSAQRPVVPIKQVPIAASRPFAAPEPDLTLDDARDLADAGRMMDSESMVRSIMSRRGPSAPALELLGTIRMSSNDVGEAKRLFEQAVYLEPTRSTSLLQLAIISERSGDSARAALMWERARRASTAGEKERQTR